LWLTATRFPSWSWLLNVNKYMNQWLILARWYQWAICMIFTNSTVINVCLGKVYTAFLHVLKSFDQGLPVYPVVVENKHLMLEWLLVRNVNNASQSNRHKNIITWINWNALVVYLFGWISSGKHYCVKMHFLRAHHFSIGKRKLIFLFVWISTMPSITLQNILRTLSI